MFPTNINQLLAINSSLFLEEIVGRVNDSSTYVSKELNTEYIFGTFSGDRFNPTI